MESFITGNLKRAYSALNFMMKKLIKRPELFLRKETTGFISVKITDRKDYLMKIHLILMNYASALFLYITNENLKYLQLPYFLFLFDFFTQKSTDNTRKTALFYF